MKRCQESESQFFVSRTLALTPFQREPARRLRKAMYNSLSLRVSSFGVIWISHRQPELTMRRVIQFLLTFSCFIFLQKTVSFVIKWFLTCNVTTLHRMHRNFLGMQYRLVPIHSRPQRPRSFWSAPRIATSGQVQHPKTAIHGLPLTLRMLGIKSDKSDWFWSQSIVFKNPFKTGMSLDLSRGCDSWC